MSNAARSADRGPEPRPAAEATKAPRGRLPWPTGLFGMLALVAGVEHFTARQNLIFVSVAESAWKWSGEHVATAARRPVIGFGDSLVKNSLLPTVLDARSGMKAWNFAVPSGVAPLHYFLFRRLIRAQARPSAVLIDSETVDSDPMFDRRVWARTLQMDEAVDLAWTTRDATFLTGVALCKTLPSYRERYGLRASIVSALAGKDGGERAALLPLWRNWNKNEGAFVLPDRNDPPGGDPRPAVLEKCCYQPTAMKPHPVNHVYVTRFLRLAAAHGVPVFWMLPPLHPEVQARRERFGRDAAAVGYARQLLNDYPGLKVIDGRHAGYPPEALFDHSHLSRTGAIVFTDVIGQILRDRNSPRWVELPQYDSAAALTLAAASRAEDYDDSSHWVNTHEERRR